MDKQIKFHVWHDGDPSAGIAGESAVVNIYLGDKTIAEMKESLKRAFETLWDFRVHVMTDIETR